MKEKRCILQIDKDPKAVIEPDYDGKENSEGHKTRAVCHLRGKIAL